MVEHMNDGEPAPRESEEPGPRGGGEGRRRRWPPRLATAGVLVAVALPVVGPPLLARWAAGRIEALAAERIDGRVEVGSVSIGLNGKAALEGLVVEDRDGAAVLQVASARFDLGIRSLLMGKKDVALRVEGVQVELVRGADGRWNVEDLLRPAPTGPRPPARDGEPLPDTPPDLEGRLELVDASVLVRSPETVLELRGVNLRVGLDGDRREYSVEGAATIAGGDGSAGDLVLDGALWPDAGPGVRVDDLGVDGLELGVVAEALTLLGAPLESGSRLAGELDLHLNGDLRAFDPEGPLTIEGAAAARRLDVALVTDGQPVLAFDDREARLDLAVQRVGHGTEPSASFSLHARGGAITVDGGWDGGAEDQAVRLLARLDDIDASAGIEPVLARVHPVFAGARATRGAGLDGLVDAEVTLVYGAPLPLARLAAGLGSIDTAPLVAAGSVSVSGGMVRPSPLVTELLVALGRPATPRFDLAPLGFAVEDGLVRYAAPWTWTIDGAETRFEGGVGLDGTLDLRWVVPVTEALVGDVSALRSMVGETFEVPLGGTLTAPRLDVQGAVLALARAAGERALREELDQRARGGLEGVLEGGGSGADAVREAARGVLGGGRDAAELLRRADRLWGEGKEDEARPLYARIREEFPLSPTYLLDRSRIEGRAR